MSMLLTLSLALLPAAALPSSAAAWQVSPQQPRVVASGSATVSVEANAATLSVAVETRGDTAAAAAEENAERMREVLDALDDAGYEGDEVSTSAYTLWPYSDRDGNAQGYTAVNTLTVQVDDIDDVGEVIDTVIEAGANNIPSVSFVAADVDEARREALEVAIRSARLDAEVMARAAGRDLGDLIEVSTEGAGGSPIPMRAAMMQESTPIVGPTQQVTVRVVTIWALR